MGSGPISIGPNMQQRFDDCKVNYELKQQNYSGGSPGYNQNLFTFNDDTGVLTINYEDNQTPSLSGQKFTLTLTGTAAKS